MDKIKEGIDLLWSSGLKLETEYRDWIRSNPNRGSDIETSVKVISYLLHGRLKSNSSLLPELLYCSSNLLSFYHNSLLTPPPLDLNLNASSVSLGGREIEKGARSIKTFLTILDYFDVFIEVGARRVWGDVGRWVLLVVLHTIKTVLRLMLLFKYKVGMIESPALGVVERRNEQISYAQNTTSSQPTLVFTLKHSGRVVRKIQASPPISSRNWKLPSIPTPNSSPIDLPPIRVLAETMHILRPLVHLSSLGLWGTLSWKPWVLSLLLDMSSLHLHGTPHKAHEKIELTRRTYCLLYYALRSPFYDTFTKERIRRGLDYLGSKVPLVGNLVKLVGESVPEWQDTYSYVWNDL